MRTPPPTPTRAESEAAAWFARLGRPTVTHQALQDFGRWRDDPANDAAYTRMEAFWSASGAKPADPHLLQFTREALERPRRRRLQLTRRALIWGGPITAAVAAAVTLVVWPGRAPTYATGPAEQRVIRLADGSRLHLNVNSKVRVAFGAGARRLYLAHGEAFFEVAHDAARPFVVDAGQARVRAVGTKFDVRREPDQVQVTLLQGGVRVSQAQTPQSWSLEPNQQLVVQGQGSVRTAATDASEATSWTTGRLVFHQTPLAVAVAEVNRYAAHPIELADPDAAGRLVDGVFDLGDTTAFVSGVCTLFDLQARPTADGGVRLAAAKS